MTFAKTYSQTRVYVSMNVGKTRPNSKQGSTSVWSWQWRGAQIHTACRTEVDFSVFPGYSQSFWSQDLSPNLKLINEARLAGQCSQDLPISASLVLWF